FLNSTPHMILRVALRTDSFKLTGGNVPPPRPINVTALVEDGRVRLNWAPSLGAEYYRIRRGTTPGSYSAEFATAGPVASFEDTSVQNGTTYFYVISAVKGALESFNSTEIRATPLVAPT